MTSPDHITLTSCGFITFAIGAAVEDAAEFASQGEAEIEALRLDAGSILEAKRKLDNLVEFLGLLNHRKAA